MSEEKFCLHEDLTIKIWSFSTSFICTRNPWYLKLLMELIFQNLQLGWNSHPIPPLLYVHWKHWSIMRSARKSCYIWKSFCSVGMLASSFSLNEKDVYFVSFHLKNTIIYVFYPFERMQVQKPCHAKVLLTHLLRRAQMWRGTNTVKEPIWTGMDERTS